MQWGKLYVAMRNHPMNMLCGLLDLILFLTTGLKAEVAFLFAGSWDFASNCISSCAFLWS